MVFVHGIYRQKEYCLSVAQILTSRYQSRVDDGMQIDCTSDMYWKKLLGISTLSCKLGSMKLRPE